MTTYAEVVHHLLGRHATDTVIANANKKIPRFKKGALMPWDFSQML